MTAQGERQSTEEAPQQELPTETPPDEETPRGMFAALHEPDYRLFYFGAMTSNIGLWMRVIAQGWLVITITNSEFYLGLTSFCGLIPTLLFSLFGGALADRFDKRHILILAQIGSSFFVGLLATLIVMGHVQIWQILVIVFINGTFTSLSQPSYQAIVPELVGRKNLMNAIALNSARFNLTRAIGPTIGGFLIKFLDIAGAYYCNALTYLVFLVAMWFVRPKYAARRATKQSENLFSSVRSVGGYIIRHKVIRPIIIITAAQTLFMAPYTTLLPAFAKNILHMGAGGYGLLLAAVGVGAFVSAMWLAFKGEIEHKGRLMMSAQVVFSAGVIAFANSRSLVISLIALVFVGWALVSFLTTGNTLVQSIVPDDRRGRVMSFWMIAIFGLMPIGSLMAGSVAAATTPTFDLTMGSIATLIVTGLVLTRDRAFLQPENTTSPDQSKALADA